MHPDRIIAMGLTALLAFAIPVMGPAGGLNQATADTPMGDVKAAPETGLTTLGFPALDADSNSKVTREEFEKQGLTEALFTTMDTDHDGALTQAEMDAHGPVMKPLQ